mmetsp:Transcript_2254/g.3887  ORF Transcript_2254/g.3887 Transcript_2254/m.3887 type:complete len:153 (+) Transcript_2254:1243-1701(+)
MWKTSIERLPLSNLKQLYALNKEKSALVKAGDSSGPPVSIKFFKFFAFLLLRGEVVVRLGEFGRYFKDSPELMLDDSSMLPKVTRMLSQLQRFDIDSKAKLVRFWRDINPCLLLDSFQLWIDPIRHREQVKGLKKVWEELVEQEVASFPLQA